MTNPIVVTRSLGWINLPLKPRSDDRVALNREQWDQLPAHLQTTQQASGKCYVGCGATHSIMERCNFSCTSCYLSEVANTVPPLSFQAVKIQLDALRRSLGPAGKAQLTSGEVTLLPKEELGRMVDYAREIGLDPMVMTNGERFFDQPGYLESLVGDYGLEKVSLHIDSTQQGRKGQARNAKERDVHALRNRYAKLIRRVRATTGKRLHAAQTVTVVPNNVDDIPTIIRWTLRNADAFRMISFQPVAKVGRTRDQRPKDLGMDAVWSRICDGLGRSINRHALHFGHPECNIVCPLVIVSVGDRHEIVETVRKGNRLDAGVMGRILDRSGGLRVVGDTRLEKVVRHAAMVLCHPTVLLWGPLYALYRLWGERRWLPAALKQLCLRRSLRIRLLAIVVHKFMDADELATSLGRERLQACTFKVPVQGQMVSMCEFNASGMRRDMNLEQRLGEAAKKSA